MEAAGQRALNLRHSSIPLSRRRFVPLFYFALLSSEKLARAGTSFRRFVELPIDFPRSPTILRLHRSPFSAQLKMLAQTLLLKAVLKLFVKLLQVVLVSPQPLGYTIEDSKLKRSGLDYWPYVVVKAHNAWSEFRDYFRQQDGEKRLLAFTKRGTNIHSHFSYRQGDWLVFGSETSGSPPEALMDCSTEGLGGGTIRIPMVETYVRCLNISVSVGIALYEASRQLNYEQLQDSSTVDSN